MKKANFFKRSLTLLFAAASTTLVACSTPTENVKPVENEQTSIISSDDCSHVYHVDKEYNVEKGTSLYVCDKCGTSYLDLNLDLDKETLDGIETLPEYLANVLPEAKFSFSLPKGTTFNIARYNVSFEKAVVNYSNEKNNLVVAADLKFTYKSLYYAEEADAKDETHTLKALVRGENVKLVFDSYAYSGKLSNLLEVMLGSENPLTKVTSHNDDILNNIKEIYGYYYNFIEAIGSDETDNNSELIVKLIDKIFDKLINKVNPEFDSENELFKPKKNEDGTIGNADGTITYELNVAAFLDKVGKMSVDEFLAFFLDEVTSLDDIIKYLEVLPEKTVGQVVDMVVTYASTTEDAEETYAAIMAAIESITDIDIEDELEVNEDTVLSDLMSEEGLAGYEDIISMLKYFLYTESIDEETGTTTTKQITVAEIVDMIFDYIYKDDATVVDKVEDEAEDDEAEDDEAEAAQPFRYNYETIVAMVDKMSGAFIVNYTLDADENVVSKNIIIAQSFTYIYSVNDNGSHVVYAAHNSYLNNTIMRVLPIIKKIINGPTVTMLSDEEASDSTDETGEITLSKADKIKLILKRYAGMAAMVAVNTNLGASYSIDYDSKGNIRAKDIAILNLSPSRPSASPEDIATIFVTYACDEKNNVIVDEDGNTTIASIDLDATISMFEVKFDYTNDEENGETFAGIIGADAGGDELYPIVKIDITTVDETEEATSDTSTTTDEASESETANIPTRNAKLVVNGATENSFGYTLLDLDFNFKHDGTIIDFLNNIDVNEITELHFTQYDAIIEGSYMVDSKDDKKYVKNASNSAKTVVDYVPVLTVDFKDDVLSVKEYEIITGHERIKYNNVTENSVNYDKFISGTYNEIAVPSRELTLEYNSDKEMVLTICGYTDKETYNTYVSVKDEDDKEVCRIRTIDYSEVLKDKLVLNLATYEFDYAIYSARKSGVSVPECNISSKITDKKKHEYTLTGNFTEYIGVTAKYSMSLDPEDTFFNFIESELYSIEDGAKGNLVRYENTDKSFDIYYEGVLSDISVNLLLTYSKDDTSFNVYTKGANGKYTEKLTEISYTEDENGSFSFKYADKLFCYNDSKTKKFYKLDTYAVLNAASNPESKFEVTGTNDEENGVYTLTFTDVEYMRGNYGVFEYDVHSSTLDIVYDYKNSNLSVYEDGILVNEYFALEGEDSFTIDFLFAPLDRLIGQDNILVNCSKDGNVVRLSTNVGNYIYKIEFDQTSDETFVALQVCELYPKASEFTFDSARVEYVLGSDRIVFRDMLPNSDVFDEVTIDWSSKSIMFGINDNTNGGIVFNFDSQEPGLTEETLFEGVVFPKDAE